MTIEEIHQAVQRAAFQLGEMADHVQIMVTWNEDGLCHRYFFGNGNWYARQGLAHEFITEDTARTNAREISEATKDEE